LFIYSQIQVILAEICFREAAKTPHKQNSAEKNKRLKASPEKDCSLFLVNIYKRSGVTQVLPKFRFVMQACWGISVLRGGFFTAVLIWPRAQIKQAIRITRGVGGGGTHRTYHSTHRTHSNAP